MYTTRADRTELAFTSDRAAYEAWAEQGHRTFAYASRPPPGGCDPSNVGSCGAGFRCVPRFGPGAGLPGRCVAATKKM